MLEKAIRGPSWHRESKQFRGSGFLAIADCRKTSGILLANFENQRCKISAFGGSRNWTVYAL
jgi:hypothetical protein